MEGLTGFSLVAHMLPQAPLLPGVYLMKNKNGNIIYVGKAKVLRKRLANYAREEEFPNYYRHKVQVMVKQVHSLEWMVTHTEKEALLLESNLIKLHKPRYNVDLRDDKSYPYFRLSVRDKFPRFHLVRKPDRTDGARYWGPLENVGAARQTHAMLQKIFPLRRCSNRQFNNRSRPCLNYEMKRCLAPCVGRISEDEYLHMVRQIEEFLDGGGGRVAEELEKTMLAAAREERFEEAALLRDRLFALKRTLESQKVESGDSDMDAWGLFENQSDLRIAIIRVRRGQLISSQVSDFSQAALDAAAAMSQGLLTYYSQDNPPPPLILLSHLPSDPSLVAEYTASLKQGKVELRLPQRGEKRALMDLALANAASAQSAVNAPAPRETLTRLARKINMNDLPERMECMDISHLGGSFTVASVVCFAGGRPFKPDYRRYKLEGIPPGDDYAAMHNAFKRRLGSSRPWPDLFVIDGGKGQLNMAVNAYQEYKKDNPDERELKIISLAKGQDNEPDKVYVPGRKNPVTFRPRDPALAMLMHIRDEAHRVAVGYQRKLRKKALTRSVLDEISGLGPVSRKKIWRAFSSLKDIKAASAEELSRQAGINLPLAQRVKTFLNNLG